MEEKLKMETIIDPLGLRDLLSGLRNDMTRVKSNFYSPENKPTPPDIGAAPAAHDHDDAYSKLGHGHDESYAPISHGHDERYAGIDHDHDDRYSVVSHSHDGVYAEAGHSHDGAYAPLSHAHDGAYAPIGHSHEPWDIGAVAESDLIDLVYPIGAIYMSTVDASPASFIGGTWARLKDRFLLASGDTYQAGDIGGSADASVVSHSHNVVIDRGNGAVYDNRPDLHIVNWAASSDSNLPYSLRSSAVTRWLNPSETVGESGTGKNMPPYLAVHVWTRAA